MIKKLLFLPIGALLSLQLMAQSIQTITYQPDATNGIDASICNRDDSKNLNFGTLVNLNAFGWTSSLTGSIHQDWRFLIKFSDLDVLKNQDATITSAKLVLNTVNPDNLGLGENAAKVYNITGDWNESTVTWLNQPTYNANSYITVPKIASNIKNVEINITTLAKNIVENGVTNYGFLYMLDSEEPYRCIQFASSDYVTTSMRPKLVVEYSLPVASLTNSSVVKKISLYPNPTTNEITINNNEKFNKISIVDALGNEKLTLSNPGNKINLSGLEEGLYIVYLSTAKDLYSEKLIIKK